MHTVSSRPAPLFSELEGGGFRGSRGGRAFAAAVLGWHVFPLRSLDGGERAGTCIATNEPADIYGLWGMDLAADHDVGIACGPSYLLVVECSTQTGLDVFLSRRGLSPALPTVAVHFGERQHLYYSTRDLAVGVGLAIFDVEGAAAFVAKVDHVVGAGSRRHGCEYEYTAGRAPDETRIAPLPPDWARYMRRQ